MFSRTSLQLQADNCYKDAKAFRNTICTEKLRYTGRVSIANYLSYEYIGQGCQQEFVMLCQKTAHVPTTNNSHHLLKNSQMVEQLLLGVFRARDQFFQAVSPFFCRGGAWVRG